MNDRVMIGYVGNPSLGFTKSLSACTAHMVARGLTVEGLPKLIGEIPRQRRPWLPPARDEVFSLFMSWGVDWLMLFDATLTFRADALFKLLESADPELRPIVGAHYYVAGERGLFPVMFHESDGRLVQFERVPINETIRVAATGSSALLIHRTVFEKLDKPWFVDGIGDTGFTFRAHQAGIPVHVNTEVEMENTQELLINKALYQMWDGASRLVVTGTGRSGTQYMSAILTESGIPCGHEQIFRPEGPRGWAWYRADASFMAVPYLPIFDGPVFHVVRDPLTTINSMVGLGWFDDAVNIHELFRPFQRLYCPSAWEDDEPLDRTIAFYIDWNRKIEPFPTARFRLEHIGEEELGVMVEAGDGRPDWIPEVLEKVPRNLNTHMRADLSWDDLLSRRRGEELADLAGEYGYSEVLVNG